MSRFRREITEPPSIANDRPEPVKPSTRVRASEAAIKAALKAMRDSGIPIGRVCITGGHVEIHPGAVEGAAAVEDDGGLKDW